MGLDTTIYKLTSVKCYNPKNKTWFNYDVMGSEDCYFRDNDFLQKWANKYFNIELKDDSYCILTYEDLKHLVMDCELEVDMNNNDYAHRILGQVKRLLAWSKNTEKFILKNCG